MVTILRLQKFLSIFLLLFCISTAFAANPSLIIEPQDGQQPLLEAIHQAKSSIDLAMYGFTDQTLLQALIDAKQAGKSVRILLQHFPYRTVNENLPAIQRFSASHLSYAYTPPAFFLLHQKTLLIDHRLAIVMSFNFTQGGFNKERNFGLVLTDPALVNEIQQVFDADWQQQSPKLTQPDLVWSPVNSRAKILALIDSAQSTIKMYAQGLTDYQVVGALARAARRGITVQILTSEDTPSGKAAYLKRAGVQFHYDKELMIHAKVIIVDQQKALLGSINFTQPSMDKNRELSVITTDPKVLQQLLQVFQSDWNP